MAPRLAMLAAVALLLAPLHADAQGKAGITYRCSSKDGKRYYGSTIPRECLGQPIEQLNQQGMVVKRIDPEGEEKAQAAREAEEEKRREQTAARREDQRRNRAVLATYTSEKDIEDARRRAVDDNRKALQEVERRIEVLKKRRAGYDKELEAQKDGNKPSAKLQEDIRVTEVDLRAQENLLVTKQKDLEAINERYDEDKKRYLELTRRPGAQRR
jgi:hypothetical protein